jgi:hypothetical protein
MPRALVVCLTLALIVSCREQPSVTSPHKPAIAAALLDGRQGGNPHFFFLPPLVEQPSFSGVLNTHLAPLVRICTLTSAGACDPTIASLDPGPVDLRGDHYEVIWHARAARVDATRVDATRTYRIQVFAGGELLGFIDAQVDAAGAVATSTGGDFGGPDDRGTLAIKFRIENGALCAGHPDCGEAAIGTGGGTVIVTSGLAGAFFPPGALTRTVTVFVAQAPTSPTAPCLPVDLVQRGGCFTFRTDPGPNTFTVPVTVGICVEIAGWTPRELSLLHLMQVDLVANQPVVTTLPNVAAPFLTCDAPHPLGLGPRLLERLRRLVVPAPLYAAHLGVGGLTGSFSTIGWGLPALMAGQAGGGQTAVVGTAVTIPPAVILRDSLGGPVPGQTVTFSVGTGGGSSTGATTLTNAAGVATVATWTLGPTPGANTLLATSRGAVGSPMTFTATGVTAATGAEILIAANADGQSATFDGTNFLVGIQGKSAGSTRSGGVFAQFVSPAGAPVGALLNTGTTTGDPPCVTSGTSNHLMAWAGNFPQMNQGGDIIGALVAPALIAITSSHDGHGTGGIGFGGGNYFVAYERGSAPFFKIYGRLVSPDGTVGAEFPISSGFGQFTNVCHAVAFDGSNFFVVWIEQSTDPALSNLALKGRFVSPAGALGTEFTINGVAPAKEGPSVAFNGSTYFVVWNDIINLATTEDVFAQQVTTAGALSGGVVSIATGSGFKFGQVSAGAGNFLVVWEDVEQNPLSAAIKSALFDGFGTQIRPVRTLFTRSTDGRFPVIGTEVFYGGQFFVVHSRATPAANPLDFGGSTNWTLYGSLITP